MTQTAPDIVLQTLCLPDPAIGAEPALFLRTQGGAALREGGGLDFAAGGAAGGTAGGVADFGTYVNLLNLDTWGGHARLEGLALRLCGQGRLRLELIRVTGGIRLGPSEPLIETPVRDLDLDLAPGGVRVGLDDLVAGGGMLRLRLTARGAAHLAEGAFVAPRPAGVQDPRLAIVITTFRREAAVTATAARLARFFEAPGPGQAIGRAARVFVIDNGQSLTLPPCPGITVIPNRNLGGAGGFARGLLAAEDGGFSHCLFMDDDASFQMEALIRAFAFLTLAQSPRAALAGAMISEGRPHAMWENGARFDRFCRPLCGGTDLRDPAQVLRMELAATRPKPPGFYGGWWFFAFPLAGVTRHPFPFFVRGDDISFSLANRFDTVTLNGVVSWQEDFAAKESPQTLYLDLRNHLHHHLVQDGMEIGRFATLGIVLRFVVRSLVRMHYDSAGAQLLAFADVMEGPRHFVANVDMAAKRAEVAGLIGAEGWTASAEPEPDPALPPPLWLAYAMKLTMNGHLLPFFGAFGRSVTLGLGDRAPVWPFWGAARLRFVDAAGGRAYSVRHDKRRFARLALRLARLSAQWALAYPGLRGAYRASYPQIASRAFWAAQFAKGPAPLAETVSVPAENAVPSQARA
jgi:galactofuranosylgalactofuranosylrhamnosyl-N-acetylglucosaminyl-diphospho-decaprenol beta-1,5/1,6-galactofuranosyltransferase